jgi:hypothetical protein
MVLNAKCTVLLKKLYVFSNKVVVLAVTVFDNIASMSLKDAVDVELNELEEDCDKACSLIFDQQNESTRSFLSYAMYGYMMEMGEDIVKSMLSDTSHLGTPLADQTDDLYLSIALKEALEKTEAA